MILLGPPGVGKTHTAIGLGLEAIQNGYRVSFYPMGELINTLKSQEYLRKFQLQLKAMKEADLFIIDDLM
jgi:DNA replication protein DnaC